MQKYLSRESLVVIMPWAAIVSMGLLWGLSFSLAKIATNLGGGAYQIAFWQAAISSILLFFASIMREPFKLRPKATKVLITIAFLGAILPSVMFYMAAFYLPAGVLAVTTALVPIFTYTIAISLRLESASIKRLLGIFIGAVAILALVGPETSLPDPSTMPWVILACIASACYAGENIVLCHESVSHIDPIYIACGMNFFAALFLFPIAMLFNPDLGTILPLGELEFILVALGVLNSVAYVLYILTVQNYGPIFASQTGYTVTVSGVVWGIVILEESHSVWIWISVATILVGLGLVNPQGFLKPVKSDQR